MDSVGNFKNGTTGSKTLEKVQGKWSLMGQMENMALKAGRVDERMEKFGSIPVS